MLLQHCKHVSRFGLKKYIVFTLGPAGPGIPTAPSFPLGPGRPSVPGLPGGPGIPCHVENVKLDVRPLLITSDIRPRQDIAYIYHCLSRRSFIR